MCQSNVREMYENLYACECNIDGSGSMLSPDARIEVIDIEDSVNVEVIETPNTPNFKEQQKNSYHQIRSSTPSWTRIVPKLYEK